MRSTSIKIFLLSLLLTTHVTLPWCSMTGEGISTPEGSITWQEIFNLSSRIRRLEIALAVGIVGAAAAGTWAYTKYSNQHAHQLTEEKEATHNDA